MKARVEEKRILIGDIRREEVVDMRVEERRMLIGESRREENVDRRE